jgi:hypothetical protein
MRRALPVFVILFAHLQGANRIYEGAKAKAMLIEQDRAKANSNVFFTLEEVNAYAAEQVRAEVPDGIRNPRVSLGEGTATGTALIDFAKVQTSRGKPPGVLVNLLLRGEREVTVQVRMKSGNGQAEVEVQRVQVGSIPLSGAALRLVIDYYVLPRYPEAAIGRPFALRHRVREIVVKPAGLTFKIGR